VTFIIDLYIIIRMHWLFF